MPQCKITVSYFNTGGVGVYCRGLGCAVWYAVLLCVALRCILDPDRLPQGGPGPGPVSWAADPQSDFMVV